MHARKNGFTIVEMIIVVVVIAVLAMVTLFAFSNWRARTAKTEMKNELLSSFSALKNNRNFTGAYPVDQAGFSNIYKVSNSVTLSYVTPDSGVTYCLMASSVNDPSKWYVGNVTAQPTLTKPAAYCP